MTGDRSSARQRVTRGRLLLAGIVFVGAVIVLLLGTSGAVIPAVVVAAGTALLVMAASTMTQGDAASRGDVDGWRQVAVEIARARRHNRSLAMLRVEDGPSGAAGQPTMTDAIRRGLRATDVAWTAASNLYVLLPEADATTITGLEARLGEEGIHVDLRSRAVVFPHDGVTVGSLREALESGARPQKLSDHRGRRPGAASDEQAS
jgi:hypothetical protein